MAASDLVLFAEDLTEIEATLTRLQRESNSRFVALIDRNGQQVSMVGQTRGLDATSLASLAAGNVAATEGLAQLLGESAFTSLYHEGERDSLHMTPVGRRVIMLIAFDEHSSLGLVRLRVRHALPILQKIFEGIDQRAAERRAGAGGGAPFAEITDADIDSLFAE